MQEGKSLFEKKKNQIRPVITFNFPQEVPHPYQYSCGISYEYLPGWPELNKREIIRLCLCHTIFINFKVSITN